MKKTLLFVLFLSTISFSQDCSQLFFSEYVEGWSNNKALEIYNPTGESIDLSSYSISRYANGGTTPSTTQLTGIINAYGTFVVCLDKQDPNGEGYEAPVWDGYFTYTDSITGQEVTTYDEDTDLQSKVDLFLNPIYYFGTNADSAAAFPTTMYFNGNDAVTLELLGTGIVIDLIGKVGEDPGASWTDSEGNYWTKDHTLRRKYEILGGVNMNPITFDPTLEWDSLPVNTFNGLGVHECGCATQNINEVSSNFTIYPNPTNKREKVYITNENAIKEILITNQLGKIIAQSKTDLTNTVIDISNYSSGLYFISIIDEYGTKTRPILIENE